jgi:hypothetical protein
MSAPQEYLREVRDLAIRLVDDLLADDQLQLSVTGACRRVGERPTRRHALREELPEALTLCWTVTT